MAFDIPILLERLEYLTIDISPGSRPSSVRKGRSFSSGARFSKVRKGFRPRKAVAKSPTLRLQSCVIRVFLT